MIAVSATTMTSLFRNVSALARRSFALTGAAVLRTITARSIGAAHRPMFAGAIFLRPAFTWLALAGAGSLERGPPERCPSARRSP